MPKVAIYVRLSREDRNKANKTDDSESIINQQLLLLEYCKQKDWSVYKIYNDEDFSGSDRDRPDFNKMIVDAQAKKFDIVLCKTQSRFARDMELIEKYINTLFPIWGVRFLSVVDNADTDNKANRKSRQINGLVDQWYLEDCSENIKAVLSSKRKQGLWVGAFAPFGYIKSPNDKNQLVVDKEAAEIVRYIFQLYLDGYGITTLTKKLNQEGIPNPATYKKQHGQPFQNTNGECAKFWQPYSVQRVLKNEIYIGNMVQGQAEKISYKSTKKRIKPKQEWDIVENTHEAIIDKDTFDLVQSILSNRRRSTKTGQATLFANKIRCLKCGGSMRSQICGHKRYYTCHAHYASPNVCEGTYVSMSVISKTVLNEIRKLYNAYIDEDTVALELDSLERNNNRIDMLQQQINNTKDELAKIQKRFKSLYYDKIDGIISADDFSLLSQDCKEQENKLQSQIEHLSNEISNIQAKQGLANNTKEIISQFKNITELDRYTVQTLIDYIEVGGNKTNRIINIHWNF
jgi:DNA invertase Pin-like site-specific DNA recombinase/uncharacterized small protein (DUF1192 family)